MDKETVAHVARLARIHLTEEEQAAFAPELAQILDWVEQLSGVETSDVPPMTSVVHAGAVLRPDRVADGGKPDAVLKNAPESAEGFFVVPKVIE